MKRIIPLILVLAALAVGVYYVRQADKTEQSQIRELYTEVEPLQKEKAALIEEREKLVEEYRISMRDPSTVQILFRENREEIFTEVYPIMRDRGVTGVLCLSSKEYPGRNHSMTFEQYNRLLMDGWGSCLLFETEYERKIDSWIDYMQRHVERDGLPMPTTVYFPDGGYDPDTMDEALLAAGINTVILNAEDGHSHTVTSVGSIWKTGAMPWNYTGVNNDVALLSVTDSANLCFTVSIENLWDAFEAPLFTSMLDSWESFLVSEALIETSPTPTPTPTPVPGAAPTEVPVEPMLRVTTFEKAREAHRKTEEGLSALVREHEEALTALDTRIAELDAEIKAIYDRWNKN